MGWRNQETHKDETKAVKAALREAGIVAEVGHGRGTAWGWLEINIGDEFGSHLSTTTSGFCPANCQACEAYRETRRKTLEIALGVTGRSGDYDGEVNVMAQSGWCQRCRISYAIRAGHRHAKPDEVN